MIFHDFRKPLKTLVLAASCCAVAAAHADTATADSQAGEAVARVNGQPVSRPLFEHVAGQLRANGSNTEDRAIAEELIKLELLAQKAEALSLQEQPHVRTEMALQRLQILSAAYLAAISEDIDIDDAELRAEYDRQVASLDITEYRASHILLDSEASALAVIQALNEGADFANLASEQSTDPSGINGGELGWVKAGNLQPEIIAAIAALEPGEYAEAPVASEFGYHVFKVLDTRQQPVPAFEDVRQQIAEIARRNALADHVENLRKEADIVNLVD